MENKRIPFSELARMEKGDIPMTEAGEKQIAKLKALVGSSGISDIVNQQRVTLEETKVALSNTVVSTGKVQRNAMSTFSFQLGISESMEQFRKSMIPFRENIKYVSDRLLEIKTTSLEVYQNEKKFYKKTYGIKIPYEQFWDLYMKKHGERSIPDVLANTDYESIACDYAEFIGERIGNRRAIVEGNNTLTTIHLQASDKVNNFNGMPLDEVEAYFMVLSTELSSNGNSFLTTEEVKMFIDKAFTGNQSIPTMTLNFAKGEKQFVWSLFHKFYVRCTTNYLYEQNVKCKDKYIGLLADHFTNFSKSELTNNFHKSATRKWPITN